MGISDNFKNLAAQIQQTAVSSAVSTTQRIFRLLTGLFVGLVLALIIQELTKSGELMLIFMACLFTAMIYKVLVRMHVSQIIIFNLICILIAALLRMYIKIAP